jgi:hypothetical protein
MSQFIAADLYTHEHEPDEHDGGEAEQDHQGHLHSSSQPAIEKGISSITEVIPKTTEFILRYLF